MIVQWAMVAGAMSVAAPTAAAAPAPPAGLCEASVRAIDASARKTLAQGSPGMLVEVAKDGKVIFAGTYGLADIEQRAPVTRDTVFKLASITKEFTAAAILLLAEDGKLELDDRLSRFVPELPQAAKVTLNQLLVHTSGIPDYAEDPSGSKTKAVAKTPQEMLAWIKRLEPPFQFEPGTKWAYSNSNYVLLGLVIERISGQPLATFFRNRLVVPAGCVPRRSTTLATSSPIARRATAGRRPLRAASGTRSGSATPSRGRRADYAGPATTSCGGATPCSAGAS